VPNAWKVIFEPTYLYLTPAGNGTFTSVASAPGKRVNPPRGSFTVVTTLRPTLAVNAKATPPVKQNDPFQRATLEFLGRPTPEVTGAVVPWIPLGTVQGTAGVNSSAATPVPQFICGTRRVPGSVSVELDFTPATKPEIVRSDWVMRIEKHPDAFDTNVVSAFFIQLPWLFVESPGRLQVTARLTINGTLESDENINTPADIPLRHDSVPEDADTKKSRFTFYGVRNLFAKANEHEPNTKVPFKVGIGGDAIAVFLHRTVTDFCAANSIDIAKVQSGVADILFDVGFNPVNFLAGQRADADCNLHWKQVNGRFMGRRITDPDQTKPVTERLESRFAAAISANNARKVIVPNGMEETIPFFDFYVFAEDVDPPDTTELARSESPALIQGTIDGINSSARTKSLHTPIILATKNGSPLMKLLSQVDAPSRINVLATTICHEMGHTFGLRHMVALRGAPPYETGDPAFQHGIMGGGGILVGSGPSTFPLTFFGPVHAQEIKRLFL
jgi:hypothetical protein